MKKEETTEEGTANPEIADSIDYMALVNKTHPLPDGWEDKLETAHMTNSVGDDVEVEKKVNQEANDRKNIPAIDNLDPLGLNSIPAYRMADGKLKKM